MLGAASTSTPDNVTHYVGEAEIVLRTVSGCPSDVQVRREYFGMLLLQKRKVDANCLISMATDRRFRLVDHLGSTDALVTNEGTPVAVPGASPAVDQQRFDPFGYRRERTGIELLDGSKGRPFAARFDSSVTRRGFTGHEQVDDSGLIHLGGRIYDPLLARFVQADPIVQDALNSQALNRYTYCLNNPLARVDPDGYRDTWVQWAMTAAAIAVSVYTGGAALAAYGGTAGASVALAGGGLIAGGAGSALFTAFAGGAISSMVGTGSMKGMLSGGFASMATFGAGRWAQGAHAHAAVRGAVMGAAAGVVAELSGGNFGHAFISAGMGSALNGEIDFSSQFVNGFAAAIVGGTISELTGGKFANGAVTAAFAYAFSEAARGGMTTGQGAGPGSSVNEFSTSLSNGYGSPDAAAIGFGGEWGPRGIEGSVEYNTAMVDSMAGDGMGPSAFHYTSPLAGSAGATTVPIGQYVRAVRAAHGRSSVVGIAHNHWDGNLKFSGLGLDTSIAQVTSLYLYNRAGQTRLLNAGIIRREVQASSVRGANALQQYINNNDGMNGRCIHGCN